MTTITPKAALDRIVVLSKPINHGSESITTIGLREPTGKDIRLCGDPFSFEIRPDGGQVTRYDAATIARYFVMLSGLPISSFDQISAADWPEIEGAVASFFGKAPEAAPAGTTGTTTS